MRKGGWYNPKNHFFVGIVAYCYMNEIFNILSVFGIFFFYFLFFCCWGWLLYLFKIPNWYLIECLRAILSSVCSLLVLVVGVLYMHFLFMESFNLITKSIVLQWHYLVFFSKTRYKSNLPSPLIVTIIKQLCLKL